MGPYQAPIQDMLFTLYHVAGLDRLAALPQWEAVTPDLVEQVLTEAGKLAGEVLAPLNQSGDRESSVASNGGVRTPAGFKSAYDQYVASGWSALPFEPEHGGQGLPSLLNVPVNEMFQSANLSWSLCPLLTQGAIELLQVHASDALRRRFLPKMVAGEWTGTMNLTEPQAGSDVGALRTRAVPQGDHYRITGQKIFITFGEHDLADNIIHLVLARTPDAPAGTSGISLFLVPKLLVNEDGSLGARNDLRCVSLEHKLGIKASPTAVMSFGDEGGAIGYLIGKENHGLACMFTMMNNARLNVGLEGLAVSERAYQQARDYARARVQSREIGGRGSQPVAIIRHPDVRRMLMTMRAAIEAMRGLAYYTMAAIDLARHHPVPAERAREQRLADLLTPVVKAWCTDLGVEMTSLGIQVHGGMGYIEETGAAQLYRDARIAPIYEGTNGIQANDLVFRKLGRDGGAAAREFFAGLGSVDNALAAAPGDDLGALRTSLGEARTILDQATSWMVDKISSDPRAAAAGAVPYLRLFGAVAAGFLLARGALAAQAALADGPANAPFHEAKLITARFYAEHILPQAHGYLRPIRDGAAATLALAEDQF